MKLSAFESHGRGSDTEACRFPASRARFALSAKNIPRFADVWAAGKELQNRARRWQRTGRAARAMARRVSLGSRAALERPLSIPSRSFGRRKHFERYKMRRNRQQVGSLGFAREPGFTREPRQPKRK